MSRSNVEVMVRWSRQFSCSPDSSTNTQIYLELLPFAFSFLLTHRTVVLSAVAIKPSVCQSLAKTCQSASAEYQNVLWKKTAAPKKTQGRFLLGCSTNNASRNSHLERAKGSSACSWESPFAYRLRLLQVVINPNQSYQAGAAGWVVI